MKTSRRKMLAATAAAGLAPGAQAAMKAIPDLEANTVKRHDAGVENLLKIQITDPNHEHCGAWPDAYGLYYPASSAASSDTFNAAYLHPQSKFYKNPLMLQRMKLGIDYAVRNTSPDGNVSLPITNFNSPPDTAFAIWGAGNAANIAKKHNAREVLQILDPFLKNSQRALLEGGVHTPNHRWVVCSALALLNEVYPDARNLKRIDQWLAEGIDIDEDGQYDERSIIGYNVIVNRSLVILASKLKRKELLDPVRRNLNAAFYLMHPGDEMVTEISHRQDRDTRGNIGVYWLAMHYMAYHDRNASYSWVAHKYAQQHAGLSMLMAFPELLEPLVEPKAPDENYEKEFRALEIARVRRGARSATLMLRGDSRFFSLRHGDAVISAVRFASAFFGKGQFIPRQWAKDGKSYVLKQTLNGPYFQPLDPPHKVAAGEWNEMRPERQRTEVCFLDQMATITETEKGFRVRMQSFGTAGVPVAVEVAVRGTQGLKMDGLIAAPSVTDGFLLPAGQATVQAGAHTIRFGPGKQVHQYTQVRGAEAKMSGGSVYITGNTPFDHTLEFECV